MGEMERWREERDWWDGGGVREDQDGGGIGGKEYGRSEQLYHCTTLVDYFSLGADVISFLFLECF